MINYDDCIKENGDIDIVKLAGKLDFSVTEVTYVIEHTAQREDDNIFVYKYARKSYKKFAIARELLLHIFDNV